MNKKRTRNEVRAEMLEKGQADNVKSTAFARSRDQKQCPFGEYGTCCKLCALGPCRINPGKSDSMVGICGADADTIASRNFARMIAAGTAAHSDHGREVTRVFLATARDELHGYEIRDNLKLRMVAELYGVQTDGKSKEKIAEEIGIKALAEFGQQDGELVFLKRAPKKRQELWRELGIAPRGIDREVVELMHRTGMGTDQDYKNIMLQASRCALADGWGGSMIGTELQDILFETPGHLEHERQVAHGEVDLGVLKEDEVNIVMHGHEPLLSEVLIQASKDPELQALAKSKGAKGINLAGMCCTANEVLVRHGIPVAGNYSQQELAIITGAVDVMAVDVQCIMEGLMNVAQCYHTKVVTTSSKAKLPKTIHVELSEGDPVETAKKIIRMAIENYPNRGKVNIPEEKTDAVVGFSHEFINYMLGGTYRQSYRPLNSNIIDGRLLGVAGVVGCERPYIREENIHTELVKELIANDILVVQTGCSALSCAMDGLMVPEAAEEFAGPGLREVCEALGIPPVLHAGSCVDNSRILIALSEMVNIGRTQNGDIDHRVYLGDDISDLPVAGCCPDWVHEKAIAIGHYFVASGVGTFFGPSLQVTNAPGFKEFLYSGIAESLGGKWGFGATSSEMAGLMIDHIKEKRSALGLEAKKERVLYDMEMRRKLEVR